jgi:glycosyltransferase involved in cell wall biosynthesis
MRVMLDVTAVPAKPVGAGVYTIELARHVAPHIDLHLAARHNDAERWREIAPAATVHAVAPSPRPQRLLWEQLGAPTLARRTSVDCWHGPHYTLPLRANVPMVVTVHDTTLIERPEWHETAKVIFFRRMIGAAAKRAGAIVAVSEYTARRTSDILRPTAPVLSVPHGVDHANFHPSGYSDAAALTALAAYGIRTPYVAFTGTHEPRKNIPGLIAAFARVAPEHPELTLVLSGPTGWGTEEVAAAVRTHDIADRIVQPGRLPYEILPALFEQAEVVAYPSFNEGFGLPALETLASGGVLLSTSGSAVETFVDDAACLVPPGDDVALADALDAMLRDDTTRATLRRRGPIVAAPYTWERSAEQHIEAYRMAMEAKA